MFFDDRLATVLRQRSTSDAGHRTQFRQLIDILGAERTGRSNGRDPSLVASAWLRIDALGQRIPAEERAAMIRERGWRFRNPDLAFHLADFEPDVASAALNRADLSSEDWLALIPRLPVRARGFLRLRRDLPLDIEALLNRLGVYDRGLPRPEPAALQGVDAVISEPGRAANNPPLPIAASPQQAASPQPAAPPQPTADAVSDFLTGSKARAKSGSKLGPKLGPKPDLTEQAEAQATNEGRSEISALVERIAQFRRTREVADSDNAPGGERMPRLPLGEQLFARAPKISGFGFAADAAGRIEWANSEIAPMVIGTRLAAPPLLGSAALETPLQRAFGRRQPIEHAIAILEGAAPISGEWIVDARPRFTDDGNFSGYVGRFCRSAETDRNIPTAAAREADRIRQLLHELRTPVTAVQGYAELIQQQLFGTAPHEYRALAAAIAADAARILAGFEELDRLARLETGAFEIETGETDLGALTRRTAAQLAQVLAPRLAGIEVADSQDGTETPAIVAIDPDEAEALLWRLLATLGGGCSAGELLRASLTVQSGFARLTCELPAQLLAEDDIFTAEVKPIGTAINAGLFGAGFALRLARAEARAVGGGLLRDDESVVLTLPLLRQADGAAQTVCETGSGTEA